MPNPVPLTGCIPILCTPFQEDGALDLPSLAREVEYVIDEGASGVAALAIASEGYKLTEAERDILAEAVVATVAGRVPVVISADGTGTEPALDRARRAAVCGADALMVLPPSFVKPGAADLLAYYAAIAETVDLPLIVQDAPQLTGVAMTPALWADLAKRTATVRYVKVEGTPQGDVISAAVAAGEGRLAVFCGWGGLSILDALERGAVGSMPAPNFTRLFADVQARYARGDFAGAEGAFAAELPYLLWTMQSVDHSVAAAKEELRRRGIFRSRHQRRPAAHLDPIARSQLARFLDRRLASS